jgi:hypothetical protein
MSFVQRAVIALLAGIGAGVLGFWAVWTAVWKLTGEHPGLGNDAWLLAGIFVPGVLVPFAVFRAISRPPAPNPV